MGLFFYCYNQRMRRYIILFASLLITLGSWLLTKQRSSLQNYDECSPFAGCAPDDSVWYYILLLLMVVFFVVFVSTAALIIWSWIVNIYNKIK